MPDRRYDQELFVRRTMLRQETYCVDRQGQIIGVTVLPIPRSTVDPCIEVRVAATLPAAETSGPETVRTEEVTMIGTWIEVPVNGKPHWVLLFDDPTHIDRWPHFFAEESYLRCRTTCSKGTSRP